MDWTPIIVAAISAAGVASAAALPVWLGQRKTRRQVEAVHDEVRTNNGRHAWQYLEMLDGIKQGQDALLTLMAEHTEADARQFDELRTAVDRLKGTLVA